MILLTAGANAQKVDQAFFDQTDIFFKKFVKDGLIDYAHIEEDANFQQLIQSLESADLSGTDQSTKIAFYINAYNLLVIKRIVDNYPLESVFSEVGFFASNKVRLEGKTVSLNTIEKEYLLKNLPDPRYHFVLVCGAKGCPPIVSFAYRPEEISQQLENQTRIAFNNPYFIRVDPSKRKVDLSQIFKWYKNDFGGTKESALEYINEYREEKIPQDYEIGFYTYDWSLNEQSMDMPLSDLKNNNAGRYITSNTVPKGTFESRSFYNLYSQTFLDGENVRQRSTFFTSTYSLVYGLTNNFNIGFDLRYRRVNNSPGSSSFLNVFGGLDDPNGRQGFTNIGPKIRWAPTQYLPNFSIQSAFWIPIGQDLEGSETRPYIDWDGASWLTQLFNDFSVGSNFSLFTELDFFIEDIGGADDLNRFSTPVTTILSYFPNPKTTIYALANFSPFWQQDFDYFVQGGLGFKYQFNPKFEFELLYTKFTNEFLQNNNGRAATYNVGFRFNR